MILGLISDAHGNLAAYRRGVEVLRELGAEKLYFLGDAVGYIPNLDVVNELARTDIFCISGNHEAILLDETYSDKDNSVYMLHHIRKQLNSRLSAYLQSWPKIHELLLNCGPAMLVHGSPNDPVFGYVYPDTNLTQFDSLHDTTVFMGNTHRPFVRWCDSNLFVNIGSCGLPRDDGRLGSVCLFDDSNRTAEIIRFDISKEIQITLMSSPPIHRDVLEVFNRRADSVFGNMYAE